MHPFEGWFRRRFERRPEGYVFRQWGQDVVFTAAEFDAFIAIRRRVWSNPVAWIGYLLAGVIAPVAIWRSSYEAVAMILAFIMGLILAMLLVHVDRKPNEAAALRATPPIPAAEKNEIWRWLVALIWVPLSVDHGLTAVRNHDLPDGLFWGFLGAAWLAMWVLDTRRWWKRRRLEAV